MELIAVSELQGRNGGGAGPRLVDDLVIHASQAALRPARWPSEGLSWVPTSGCPDSRAKRPATAFPTAATIAGSSLAKMGADSCPSARRSRTITIRSLIHPSGVPGPLIGPSP